MTAVAANSTVFRSERSSYSQENSWVKQTKEVACIAAVVLGGILAAGIVLLAPLGIGYFIGSAISMVLGLSAEAAFYVKLGAIVCAYLGGSTHTVTYVSQPPR